jgi:putative methyltransferase (TIGR04325 family)
MNLGFLRDLTPPVLIKLFRSLNKPAYGWSGDFPDWETAAAEVEGYNSNAIISKVKESLLKVKNGEAVYERDSCLFQEIEYSYPLLASLLWVAFKNEGKLDIIDFGGSLGSTYYQNKRFLKELRSVSWSIIEQESFYKVGIEYFEDKELKFFWNMDECLSLNPSKTILFSSTIQYLNEPYAVLKSIVDRKFEFIIFDRTYFLNRDLNKDRITVQRVSPTIYEASYPCWFFSQNKFMKFFEENGYSLIYKFETSINSDIRIYNKFEKAVDMGFFFVKCS